MMVNMVVLVLLSRFNQNRLALGASFQCGSKFNQILRWFIQVLAILVLMDMVLMLVSY